MKKIIHKFIISGITIMALLGFASNALAVASLEVLFTPDPLFNEVNFLPLDETSGTVKVTNNSGATKAILTEAINVSDNDNFGSLLHLNISGGTPYDDSLADFFGTAGEVPLGLIANGESKTFTYTISFIDSSDNSYQGKTLGFDICVGFQGDTTTHCGDTVLGSENDTSGGGSGGRGGNVLGSGNGGDAPTVLAIINERISGLVDVNEFSSTATATIVWDTNVLSTSQVVYGPTPPAYALDMNALFFGYPSGTVEDPIKVTNHSVLLTGLTEGQTYVYRVVSRASPPTISFERQFTTPMSAPVFAQAGNNNKNNNFTGSNLFFDTGVSGISEIDTSGAPSGVNSEREIMAKEENALNLNNNLLAAAALFFSLGNLISNNILIFIFLIFIILYMVWKFWLHKKS